MLLSKLGITDEELDTLSRDEELLERLIEALTLLPSLVVIDDLDSLSNEEQAQIFQELGMVFSRTAALSPHPSRCVFTARELVGAAPRQTSSYKALMRGSSLNICRLCTTALTCR